MYKESVAAPNPHGCSIADSAPDFMKTYEESVKDTKITPRTLFPVSGALKRDPF